LWRLADSDTNSHADSDTNADTNSHAYSERGVSE
jgi:hypothetical protein